MNWAARIMTKGDFVPAGRGANAGEKKHMARVACHVEGVAAPRPARSATWHQSTKMTNARLDGLPQAQEAFFLGGFLGALGSRLRAALGGLLARFLSRLLAGLRRHSLPPWERIMADYRTIQKNDVSKSLCLLWVRCCQVRTRAVCVKQVKTKQKGEELCKTET